MYKLLQNKKPINSPHVQSFVHLAKDSFITTWTEMSFLGADHRRPTFPEPFVTKPVVTQGTNRYQMKDMDMIFLQIPLSLLQVKCFRCYGLSKSIIVLKFSKMLESDQFCSALIIYFWVPFFKRLPFKLLRTKEDFCMKPEAVEAQNTKFSTYERSSLISLTNFKVSDFEVGLL